MRDKLDRVNSPSSAFLAEYGERLPAADRKVEPQGLPACRSASEGREPLHSNKSVKDFELWSRRDYLR